MRLITSIAFLSLLGGCLQADDDVVPPTSYDGVWTATWSFHVDLINTGTTFARDCDFHGGTTMSIWGENNFGPVDGTEAMVCSNANNPSAQYQFGGHVDGESGVISGAFTYWGSDSLSFAGSCSSPTSCRATGSNAFVITFSKQR